MIYYTNYIISFAIAELGMEQIVAQDSSWMKIMSNSDLTSRIVLTIKEFFQTFCENNLMSLKIIFFLPFTTEQIDSFWISWSFAYSFECHFLLKQCFQKEQSIKSAWYSLLQFEHLKVCRHGLPFFFSNLGGLILLLALQYHVNSQW